MDENPYKAPQDRGAESPGEPWWLKFLPPNWLVIMLLLLILALVLYGAWEHREQFPFR